MSGPACVAMACMKRPSPGSVLCAKHRKVEPEITSLSTANAVRDAVVRIAKAEGYLARDPATSRANIVHRNDSVGYSDGDA